RVGCGAPQRPRGLCRSPRTACTPWSTAARSTTPCSSSGSHPASRPTLSRSAKAGFPRVALLVGCGRPAAALLVALPQEAGELRRQRFARRDVGLVDLVGAPLELLDVGSRLLVGRDRLADLADVGL